MKLSPPVTTADPILPLLLLKMSHCAHKPPKIIQQHDFLHSITQSG